MRGVKGGGIKMRKFGLLRHLERDHTLLFFSKEAWGKGKDRRQIERERLSEI